MTYMCSGIFGIQHPNQAVNLTTTLKYLVFTSKFLSAWLCFALNSRLRLQRFSSHSCVNPFTRLSVRYRIAFSESSERTAIELPPCYV
jgi:hypothetical protein